MKPIPIIPVYPHNGNGWIDRVRHEKRGAATLIGVWWQGVWLGYTGCTYTGDWMPGWVQ